MSNPVTNFPCPLLDGANDICRQEIDLPTEADQDLIQVLSDGRWFVQCDHCDGDINITRAQVVEAIGEEATQNLESLS